MKKQWTGAKTVRAAIGRVILITVGSFVRNGSRENDTKETNAKKENNYIILFLNKLIG